MTRAASGVFAGTDSGLAEVSSRVAESFCRGAALELSGGVDSRFVLALGLAAGERPSRVITLDAGGGDAEVATQIAGVLGCRHRMVRFEAAPSGGELLRDAVDFVRASGLRSNATAFALLPAVFRQLADFRDEQIGGVGGEVAAGFYHTPFDVIWPRLPLSLWVRLRLALPGDQQVRVFHPSARRALEARSHARLRAALGLDAAEARPWRARVDALYRVYRMGNWAAATLTASSRWYRVTMPLMSDAYFAWADGVPAAEHRSKRAQRGFIERIDGGLGAIPYGVERKQDGSRSSGARSLRKLRRIAGRLARQRRSAPELAQRAAVVLASESRFRDALRGLSAWNGGSLGLRLDAIEAMTADPVRNALELGALATAAIRVGLLEGDSTAGPPSAHR
jgi:hypothetical protein